MGQDDAGAAASLSDALGTMAFERAPIAMALLSPEGAWLRVNEALCKLLGYSASELLATTFQKVTHPDDLEADLEHVRRLLAGEIDRLEIEKRYLHRSGAVVWGLLSVSLVRTAAGTPELCISHIVDLTASKAAKIEAARTEVELRRSTDALNAAQRFAGVGSWGWHIPSNRLEWSDEMHRIFGIAKEQFTGDLAEVIARAIHPDDRAAVERATRALTEGGNVGPLEYRVIGADGAVRFVLAEASEPRRDERGQLVEVSGVVQDITPRRKLDDTLRFLAQHSGASDGEGFFRPLARYLAGALGADFICVVRRVGDGRSAETLAVFRDGRFDDDYVYGVKGTPCGEFFGHDVCVFPADLCERFPLDARLQELEAESYIGVTLRSAAGEPIGLIAVISRRPIVDARLAESILRVVAVRAAGELEREQAEEERLRNLSLQQMMSSASPMGYLVVDNQTDEIRFFNKRFCEIWGIEHLAERMERGELKNGDIIPDCLLVLADVPAFAASCAPLQSEANRVVIDDEIPFTAGRTIRRYSSHLRGADDRYYGRFYLFEDVTARKQAERREAAHLRTMAAMASGVPLAEVLTTVVRGVEAQHPDTLGSVLLLDEAGTHLLTGAAPSLPPFYNDAIHGVAVGPTAGSCGTAAFRRERVVVANIQTDPLWADYKELAAQAGLAACWSEPIVGQGGRLLGTLAFYFTTPRVPNEAELATLVAAAKLAAVAIERRRAEELLRTSNQLLEASQSIAKVGGWELDLVTKKLFWTAETYRLHDTSPAEFEPTLAASVGSFLPDSRRIIAAALEAAMERGEGYDLVLETLTTKGRRIDVRTTCEVTMHDGRPAKLTGIFQDLGEQKQAEAALRESEQKFRSIVESEPECVKLLGKSCELLEMNPAGLEMIAARSMEQVRGRNTLDLIDPKYHLLFSAGVAAVFRGETTNQIFELIALDGQRRWVEQRAVPLWEEQPTRRVKQMLAVARDITARKAAEAEREALQVQLQQSQKLDSIGQLAGGVAHDFNNMLSVILGTTELALDAVPVGGELHADLVEIRTAAERSAALTRQLLAFARQEAIVPRRLDLNETVAGMLTMLRRLLGEDLAMTWTPGVNLGHVKMDPSQVDQLMANLCINARDAVTGVGTVSIRTANATLDRAQLQGDAAPVSGAFVLLSVSDNGSGMDASTLGRVFEPFFTTKEVGKGTGLGLSTVYGIVKQNGGGIDVVSELGKGTTFSLYLPRDDSESAGPTQASSGRAKAGGGETVLVVDDEPALLVLCKRFLTSKGYAVLTANTAREAMTLAAEHSAELRLLLTDVIMPEMSGRELSEQLTSLYPEVRCVFMSGYTADIIATRGVLEEGVAFVQKPFLTSELGAKVRSALDAPSPTRQEPRGPS